MNQSYPMGFKPHLSSLQKHQQGGFTIIELMIVIAIIAILIGVSAPNLLGFTVRAKVSEAFNTVSPIKLSVSEAYIINGVMPADDFSGLPTAQSKYVESIDYSQQDDNHAILTINMHNLGSGIDDGSQFALYAIGNEQGIDWDCAQSDSADGIPPEHLPSNCSDEAPDPNDPDTYRD